MRALRLARTPPRDLSSVARWGKGKKLRRGPLWSHTARALTTRLEGRAPTEPVWLTRGGRPITRCGMHPLVERSANRGATKMPGWAAKRVSPQTMRHTTATHWLRAGVDINTLRAWRGHGALHTTNIYAATDLETKAQALAHGEGMEPNPTKRWREDKGLMTFLPSL